MTLIKLTIRKALSAAIWCSSEAKTIKENTMQQECPGKHLKPGFSFEKSGGQAEMEVKGTLTRARLSGWLPGSWRELSPVCHMLRDLEVRQQIRFTYLPKKYYKQKRAAEQKLYYSHWIHSSTLRLNAVRTSTAQKSVQNLRSHTVSCSFNDTSVI